ncbi:MAG: twin-arginine translocase TatA/TatE family subunit [Acidimicrobiales bacterium]
MLNIGPGELILIGLVLLIAVGPEQLPGLIRRIGHTVGQARSMTDSLRSEFMSGLDEIERAADPNSWAASAGPSLVKPQDRSADSDSDGDADDDPDSEADADTDIDGADSEPEAHDEEDGNEIDTGLDGGPVEADGEDEQPARLDGQPTADFGEAKKVEVEVDVEAEAGEDPGLEESA